MAFNFFVCVPVTEGTTPTTTTTFTTTATTSTTSNFKNVSNLILQCFLIFEYLDIV